MTHWGFIRKVGHLDMVTRREAEEEVSRLKALIDALYNAYSNDRDPMRADTISNLYRQKDSK